MRLAIMQPYFLPYIGYFQLMSAADIFVYYDDVNFIKQSWINRNRILLNRSDFLFTLELKGASSFRKINEIEVGNNRHKLLKTFLQAYRNAPFFNDLEPLLNDIFQSTEKNLSAYIVKTHRLINEYLCINTKFLISSAIDKNNSLRGELKVMEICRKLEATEYINAPGGRSLYSKSSFSEEGISLLFLEPQAVTYKQYDNDFIPWLSIIDIMMFNPVSEIQAMLKKYELK